MVQGVYKFPSTNEELNFSGIDDRMPPCNIEAEEEILGGILFDPNAIHRVKDILKPEHFYISVHRDIYQACLRLCRQDKPNDLLSVTSWLEDKGILGRVGGRSKLRTVVDRTTGTANIDHLSSLVIEKYHIRRAISTLNRLVGLFYDNELDLTEKLSIVRDNIEDVISAPTAKTQEDLRRNKFNRLVDELKRIYTTIPDIDFRYFELNELANRENKSTKYLEGLYARSLVANQISKLMNYQELGEAAKAEIREWFLNGLMPKRSSIVLYADGGIGKTKFIYNLAKAVIEGKDFGDFSATGSKRRILFYQGDERPADMYSSLQMLGYDKIFHDLDYSLDDIDYDGDTPGKYIRVRFGWSFENMPLLIKDIQDFDPDLIICDSLTYLNRFSPYKEGDMEYVKPLLEINNIIDQYGKTFVVIHHANKGGDIRGTTAIRNSVSEVWKLSKDPSQTATPEDRILEIDKSRSRSSGKRYRLIFNGNDLTFTYLGEDEGIQDKGKQSAKELILEFFRRNRNIKYEAEEVSEELNINFNTCRTTLSKLAVEAILSVERKGKRFLYYLKWDNNDSPPPPPDDHPSDHLKVNDQNDQESDQENDQDGNAYAARGVDIADHLITENAQNFFMKEENFQKNCRSNRSDDQQQPEVLHGNSFQSDHFPDHYLIDSQDDQQSDQVVGHRGLGRDQCLMTNDQYPIPNDQEQGGSEASESIAPAGDVEPTETQVKVKDSDLFYTPPDQVNLVVQVLGAIDLDPCADDGKHIPAGQHYTASDDGLSQPWHGRVFMNPPYSHPGKWVVKLEEEYKAGRVTEAIALLPVATGTKWQSPLLDKNLVCFWRGRVTFLDKNYQECGSSFKKDSLLVYWGNNPDKFREIYSAHGSFNSPIVFSDFTPPPPEFTEEEVIGNVELIRESISAQSWEMITVLTESWPEEFKKAVWQRLTPEEKKLIRKMSEVAVPSDDKAKKAKQKSEATTHDDALPLIETGGIYWSSSQNSKVRVRGEVWAGHTVRCIHYPDGRFDFEQKCQDLRCCEESPRSDLKSGDKVFIKVKGKYYNEVATVRSIGAIGAYLTVEPIGLAPKKLDKPYFAHQLLKYE